MSSPLPYLHLVTPLLLLLPLLSLLRAPKAPIPEPEGIRPITVRRVTPRRGLIITTLLLLAFTSFLDGVLLIVDLLSASSKDGELILVSGRLGVDSWVFYSLGGVVVWSMAAILAEYRAKWGDKALVVLATLGLMMEIPNLVLLAILVSHAVGHWRFLTILALVPPILRILHYPILFIAVSTPRITYEPADESTSLLGGSSNPDDDAYGTFENGQTEDGQPSTSTSQNGTTTAAQTGTNTPKGKPIVIPKKLGETKKEDQPLDWRVVGKRIKQLGPHLWPSTSRRLQVHVVICMLIVTAGRFLQPALPLSLGRVVRALTTNQGAGTAASPWKAFATYFSIRMLVSGGGLLSFCRERLWIGVSQYTDREMMLVCFNHLLDLSLAYHTRRNTGEVLKVIDRGSAMNNLLSTVLFTALPTFFDIIIAFGIFYFLYGPALAGMILIVMSLYLAITVTMTQRRASIRRQLTERDVKQRGIISDVLTNWESVKYFTAEQRESLRFREAIVSYQEVEKRWQVNYQLVYLVQAFLLTLGLLSGSILIAYRVLIGTSDAAEFVVFLQYYQQLAAPLNTLGYLYRMLNQNSLDAEKMLNLLAEATEVNDKPGAKDLVITDGVVEFDNVRFSYDGKVEALKGVSFKIDKGQSMALVGESGSGKSTVLRLLYRFYDVNSGVIRIDGQDISQVTQKSLRKAIGIVPQDSVLWNDTIGANISYGKEGATDEEIITAAESARLHERILGFSEGYSTIVGERGIRLSGGEKQRVSLARMFLKSPAILVLDEATSALDTETEREIQRALADLAKGRTSLSIAHRLSTIINSDQIVVMKDGQVIEQGGYNALVELDGAFASMWKKQIFTEAEMLAQAGGEQNLIDLDQPEQSIDGKDAGPTGDEGQVNDTAVIKEPTPAKESAEPVKNPTGNPASATAESSESREAGNTVDKQVPAQPAPADRSKQIHADSPAMDEASQAEDQAEGFTIDTEQHSPETYAEAVKADLEQHAGGDGSAGDSQSPETYAEAVKAHTEESANDIQQTQAPEGASEAGQPKTAVTENPQQSDASSPTVPEPVPARQSLERAKSSGPSSRPDSPSKRERATPEKRISFPPMPRMSTSNSAASGLSDQASMTSSPSGTPTGTDGSPEDTKGDKRRKRLSSIKGFVRRISDQGITRSPSYSGKKSPMGELDLASALAGGSASGNAGEQTAGGTTSAPGEGKKQTKEEKRKKRLSLKSKP